MPRHITPSPVESLSLPVGSPPYPYLSALIVTNVSAEDRYVFLLDGTDASGALREAPLHVPAGETVSLVPETPLRFDDGIFIASSSAAGAFTATGTADLMLSVNRRSIVFR